MSKGQYNYYDPDYDLNASHTYELLLKVSDAVFSFMIVLADTKKVLIWGDGYQYVELDEPVELVNVLGAKYADVKVVVSSTSFTVIPKDLFKEADIPEYGRFLTISTDDSILLNELDANSIVLFKIPTSLIKRLKPYADIKSIFFSGKVLIAAIENGRPNNATFYAHVDDNRIQLAYFKNGLLTLYNCFEFSNPDELMYFLVLTANELDLNLDETSVVLSGDISISDKKIHRVSDLLPKVNFNQTKIVSLPQGFLPHQILMISGLILCASLVEN